MPRVALSKEQMVAYKLKDIKGWIHKKMKLTGKKQSDIANVLGVSNGRVSQMLKNYDPKKEPGKQGEKDPFSYGQLLLLCDFFGADEEEKERLLTI